MGWFYETDSYSQRTYTQAFIDMCVIVFTFLLQAIIFILPILILSILMVLLKNVEEYLQIQAIKKKLMKSCKDINFSWKDIHIDKDIKKLLQDNVTRPLSIRTNAPKLSLPNVGLPKGVLFSSPSGMGKTLLAMIVAKESQCNLLNVDASDFIDCYYGESEKKVKRIFKVARQCQPCIVFIDEIDTIMSTRETWRSFENSIKGVFLTCWDGIYTKNSGKPSAVVVIGATNRPKALDPAFLRRLDLNIDIKMPDTEQRQRILQILMKGFRVERDFDIKRISELAVGFTGSDLKEAVRFATMTCSAVYHKQLEKEIGNTQKEELVKRGTIWCFPPLPFFKDTYSEFPITNKELTKPKKIVLTMKSMEDSILHSKTSRSSTGGVGGLDPTEIIIISNLIFPCDIETTWNDIRGCENVIQAIKDNVILPMSLIQNKKIKVSKFLQCPKGILLHGPPGTGKTLLAKAVARHSGCAFINLQPSMLESKWQGETSKRTAALFSVAEKYQPCIIFIDEIDAYLRGRSSSDSEYSAGKKAQFLSLLDGVLSDPKKVIILMGATNRKEDLDPALLRRLTLQFHITTPDSTTRKHILELILKDEKLSNDVCLESLVDATDQMTGADLKDVLRGAIIESLKECFPDHADHSFHKNLSTQCLKNKEVNRVFGKTYISVKTEVEDAQDNNNVEETLKLDQTSSSQISVKTEVEDNNNADKTLKLDQVSCKKISVKTEVEDNNNVNEMLIEVNQASSSEVSSISVKTEVDAQDNKILDENLQELCSLTSFIDAVKGETEHTQEDNNIADEIRNALDPTSSSQTRCNAVQTEVDDVQLQGNNFDKELQNELSRTSSIEVKTEFEDVSRLTTADSSISIESLQSRLSDDSTDLEQPVIIEIKMKHFVIAIENLKTSRSKSTDAHQNMYF